MEAKWIKLDTKVFENPKLRCSIEFLKNRDTIYVIWFKLLCLAGQEYNDGCFIRSDGNPMEMRDFEMLLSRPKKDIAQALEIFVANNMLRIMENGCYKITNWNEYQSIQKFQEQLAKKRKHDRERMAALRHKQKLRQDAEMGITPETLQNEETYETTVDPNFQAILQQIGKGR